AVEACLSHGLKRRTLGLFKTSSTTALIHKLGKTYDPASHVSRIVTDLEQASENTGRRSSSSSDSSNRLVKPPLVKKNSGGVGTSTRYLWIRVALFEKVLAKIIDYLVQNSSKYYEKDSLVADSDYGTILSSLLVGPCALDYSRMKTVDHLWTDPPADELVQRHRISKGPMQSGPSTPPQPRRPGLHDITHGGNNRYRKPVGGSCEDMNMSVGSIDGRQRSAPLNAREYVESLHQNNKATLLYGKNNVHVQPKEHIEAMPGYMSLHQTPEGMTIKWTPNHLMNGCCPDPAEDKRFFYQDYMFQKSIYWEYALNVRVDEIVYVHCHQHSDSGGTIVLVGQDGTQYPPIHFPRGGHLLAFLSCLENGLLPHGQLDPPLWSQRGKGKVFPKLRRKARAMANKHGTESSDDEESTDYVFRIISTQKPERISHFDLMSPLLRGTAWLPRVPKLSSHSSSTSSSKSLSLGDSMSEAAPPPTPNPSIEQAVTDLSIDADLVIDDKMSGDHLEILCTTMKQQIISRAFYGWLAHCRHLRTVRTHLIGLVLPTNSVPTIGKEWDEGLTEPVWASLHENGRLTSEEQVLARVYLGGVNHELRKEVWPYLLGHHKFGMTKDERQEQDKKVRQTYETTMSEWLAVEAIVRQRDKEIMAQNMAKLSSESTNGEIPLVGRERSLSNEVFEPDSSSLGSMDNPTTVHEEDENVESLDDTKNIDEDKDQMNETVEVEHTNEINEEQVVDLETENENINGDVIENHDSENNKVNGENEIENEEKSIDEETHPEETGRKGKSRQPSKDSDPQDLASPVFEQDNPTSLHEDENVKIIDAKKNIEINKELNNETVEVQKSIEIIEEQVNGLESENADIYGDVTASTERENNKVNGENESEEKEENSTEEEETEKKEKSCQPSTDSDHQGLDNLGFEPDSLSLCSMDNPIPLQEEYENAKSIDYTKIIHEDERQNNEVFEEGKNEEINAEQVNGLESDNVDFNGDVTASSETENITVNGKNKCEETEENSSEEEINPEETGRKGKSRQPSKDSDPQDLVSPTCVITPDEGVDAGDIAMESKGDDESLDH
ncbi:unnamed protein product, partial [Meganyctiphanes norvegica]